MRARLDHIEGLGSANGNGLTDRAPRQNEGCDAGSESKRKRVQRFNAGVIVDIIDLRAARVFVDATLCKRMRVDQDAVAVILMNMLKRRQAEAHHQANARL